MFPYMDSFGVLKFNEIHPPILSSKYTMFGRNEDENDGDKEGSDVGTIRTRRTMHLSELTKFIKN